MLGQRQGPRARRILRKDLLVTLAPTALIIVAAFGITMLFVKPAPPKKLTIAVAPDEGGSRYYARRYQEILKRHGIHPRRAADGRVDDQRPAARGRKLRRGRGPGSKRDRRRR